MILFRGQDPLPAQLTDLGGKSASIHLQIVRQLLSIIGDRKAVASLLLGGDVEVGHELISCRPLGGDLQLAVEHEILGGGLLHKVVNDAVVKGTGIATGTDDATDIDHEQDRVSGGDDIHR